MARILVTYNICGISKDNTDIYPSYLERIVSQKMDDECKIIVSACCPRERTIPTLMEKFPQCSYNVIHDRIPVNASFNHAVLEGVKKWGKFDAYVYVTCDSIFNNNGQMQDLFNMVKNNENYGMVSARIDRDSCYAYGLKLGRGHWDDAGAMSIMFAGGSDYIVPVGRACAAHVNIYSSRMFDFYGRCCPDVFSGYCTESVFTFVCGAIKQNWVISAKNLVSHTPSLDVPSAGFRPEERAEKTYYQGFKIENLEPIFNNEYAISLGLGLEECQNIHVHREDQYDENGFCINDKLKDYIKENLYLPEHIFNYNEVKSDFYENTSSL